VCSTGSSTVTERGGIQAAAKSGCTGGADHSTAVPGGMQMDDAPHVYVRVCVCVCVRVCVCVEHMRV